MNVIVMIFVFCASPRMVLLQDMNKPQDSVIVVKKKLTPEFWAKVDGHPYLMWDLSQIDPEHYPADQCGVNV